MNYELFISLRYLKARRKQIFLSVITLIAVAGVALGVAALITTLSVMNGFQSDLREKILGVNAHMVVFSQKEFDRKQEEELRGVISGVEEVEFLAPFTYSQVMLKSGPRSQGVVLKGIDPGQTLKVTSLDKYITSGSWDELSSSEEHGIVLGKELAKNLGVWVDSEIFLFYPSTQMGTVPRLNRFKVKGIFESGMYDYDSNLAYINIELSKRIFQSIGGFEIKVKNIYHARELADTLNGRIKGPFIIRSWDQTHRNLFAALKLEKTMMFIILILIVFVASFNIISLLMLMAMEKTRDIGILKAMGAQSSSIRKIFFLQGGIIGILGTITGSVIGIILCLALKRYHFIDLPPDIYYLSTLPVEMKGLDFLLICLAAIGISLVASLYPATRAAGLDPCRAIRYE